MMAAGELSGTMTTGSYRLVRALENAGGDTRVHEARHDRLSGRFVVKLLGEVEPRAFQRGIQQASALRHPGIVKIVDYGEGAEGAFVVMEYVEGRSLASIIEAQGALAPDAVARLVDSIALGLQAAHRQGLAHGHLSPARIFVLAPGAGRPDLTPGAERTKIFGFGMGDELTPGPLITEVTPYTAPEQLSHEASPLADQFALAAIAYELLTGVPPEGDAAARRAPRSIREYDPTINVIVDDVVQRALSFDPGARWADVYTFSKRLREVTVSAPGAALEEKTRLAPLPLTVNRAATALPPFDFPVIASVDVDLRTPAPKRLELPLQGEISMNPRPSRPSNPSRGSMPGPVGHPVHSPLPRNLPSQYPGQVPTPRSVTGAHYSIRPTPTFSFTDEPSPASLYKPRRRSSGGGLGLAFLVIVAGLGGYYAVQTRAWQDPAQLVVRAKDLARRVRALVSPAAPEPVAPATPSAAAPTAPAAEATAREPNGAAPTLAAPTPASPRAAVPASPTAVAPTPSSPPAMHPDVVQIAPAPQPVATRHPPKAAVHHASHAHHSRPAPSSVFDEAAAEEALLAPTGGR
jgi:serine/threonine protein kinase